ncbi:MAG: hypothetical protein H7A51_16725 [Akkermansiaceae bacterium]|nr:hypothetical protein [Akkermansiaceae bacterium]
MSENPPALPNEDKELTRLVELFLEQRLDEASARDLEARLRQSADARAYYLSRLRLHTDLRHAVNPMKIEIEEGRKIVIEPSPDGPLVSSSQTGMLRVQPALGTSSVAGRRRAWAGWTGAVLVLLVLALAAYIWFDRQTPPAAAIELFPLENASFEADTLADGGLSHTPAGWNVTTGSSRLAFVINPTNDPAKNRYGGAHCPTSESHYDGSNVLVLSRDNNGRRGWANQTLYGRTGAGSKVLQLGDLDGRSLRVTATVGRASADAGAWARQAARLLIGVQEMGRNWRPVAVRKINVGPAPWDQADDNLALANDEVGHVSFELRLDVGEMRGDAVFFLYLDPTSPSGSEVFVDDLDIELIE